MNAAEARVAIESLRSGIPPTGYVRQFTVGRKHEIDGLTERLVNSKNGALLVKANYGAGKSHLLRFIREDALSRNFAVSSVTVDSGSEVRFNRMDQIFGAVVRGLELPGGNQKGIRLLFDGACRGIETAHKSRTLDPIFWNQVSNYGRWDYSEALESQAMYVALRAWCCKVRGVQDLVAAWLMEPWRYSTKRKVLYAELVGNLRSYFRDSRPEYQFYNNQSGVFDFRTLEYDQSWKALRDLFKLARAIGLEGLVILFDEFEDVLTNLPRVDYKESAFWNLFRFYAGTQFPGMTFFAVTPEFVEKCAALLLKKGRWDFDYSRFQELPSFQMSPLSKEDLIEFSAHVTHTHGLAFGWQPDQHITNEELQRIIYREMSVQVQDRVRNTIKAIVTTLDRTLEDLE